MPEKASQTDMPADDSDGQNIVLGGDLFPQPAVQEQPSFMPAYALMLREIASWGRWLLFLGVVHLIGFDILNAPWGVLLLIVGASSFYFKEASIFVIYAVTLLWAAVSNMLGGGTTWLIFGVFQVYLAVRVFMQFFRFRKAQSEFNATLDEQEKTFFQQRGATMFPWTGCLFSALGVTGVLGFFVLTIITSSMQEQLGENVLGLVLGLLVDFGVLGLALSLASLLSGFRYKVISWLGLVASALLLLAWIGLVLIA
jgi:hypothetical protein